MGARRMMKLEVAAKAVKLASERRQIEDARFVQLVGQPYTVLVPDEEMAQAIEAFRQRRLAELDAQIRQLGFEP
jgi:hypothetical protein